MTTKCVHKGCGKKFTDVNEECVYHPGPPVFHEGQKGWQCCKPRVLTFDEFLAIPPCTKGKHSTIDEGPARENQPRDVKNDASRISSVAEAQSSRIPQPLPAIGRSAQPPAPALSESEEDDLTLEVHAGKQCRRRGCHATFSSGLDREAEKCTHHPGSPIFHEGAKGWSCCKKRVTDFDDFLRIPGCVTKTRHMFVGRGKPSEVEQVHDVRYDFYQTPGTVIASIFLKQIDKSTSSVVFEERHVRLDLRTADKKHYVDLIPIFGVIDPETSYYNIMKTKLELTMTKTDGIGWPVLRADERKTGEIIQTGRAGVA